MGGIREWKTYVRDGRILCPLDGVDTAMDYLSVESSLDLYKIRGGYFNLGYFDGIVIRSSMWIRAMFVLLIIENTVPSTLPGT